MCVRAHIICKFCTFERRFVIIIKVNSDEHNIFYLRDRTQQSIVFCVLHTHMHKHMLHTHCKEEIYNWRCAYCPTIISASLSAELEPWRRFASSLLGSRFVAPGVKVNSVVLHTRHAATGLGIYWLWDSWSIKKKGIKNKEEKR